MQLSLNNKLTKSGKETLVNKINPSSFGAIQIIRDTLRSGDKVSHRLILHFQTQSKTEKCHTEGGGE
jgi:hypothetical protein